jgi:hypothetical protein
MTVTQPSPASPQPTTILGLAPAIFYSILAGIIVVIAAIGSLLRLRSRRSRPAGSIPSAAR